MNDMLICSLEAKLKSPDYRTLVMHSHNISP